MNSALRKLGAAAIAAAVLASASMPAEAGHRHGYRHGDAIAAGIAGAVIGAIIAAPPVYAAPVYVQPAPVYVAPPPPPVYVEPDVVYVEPDYDDPYYDQPDAVYFEPAPVLREKPYSERRHEKRRDNGPRVVTYEDTVAGGEPWSPEWYDYCRARFRSFDPKSGTYLGYDGRRHFCVVR